MELSEFKKRVRKEALDVEILVNEGSIYLIQAVCDERSFLLTEGGDSAKKTKVFRSLLECYDQLKALGIKQAYVVQSFAHCEIITQQENFLAKADRRLVRF